MQYGTLVHHLHGYQIVASDFLIFALGLSYALSKLKERGKIITKLWKIITKSQGKIKKSETAFCRSALLLLFCENCFCLSQLIKKLNSTEQGALFRHFASPRWSPLRMRTKVVSIFIFFQELSNKKKLRLYDQRWLKSLKGGGVLSFLSHAFLSNRAFYILSDVTFQKRSTLLALMFSAISG